MAIEKEQFEQAGLVLDKERVLTYSKLVCPLECKYYFVENLNREQQKEVSYLSEQQIGLLQ